MKGQAATAGGRELPSAIGSVIGGAVRTVLRRLRGPGHRPRRLRAPAPPDDRELARHLADLARRYREAAERREEG